MSLGRLTPSSEFMVVFKSGTSQEEMDRQIAQVKDNGGTIERNIDSIIMKVRVMRSHGMTLGSFISAQPGLLGLDAR